MTEATLFKTQYDRQSCEVGVVHVGYGAFHRAHQAIYFDDFVEATGDSRWGIAAVNLRRADSASFQEAATIDDGYTLKTIAPDGTAAFRLVRPHLSYVDATTDPIAAFDLLSQPSVTLVTITVTESGYYFKNDWSLDLEAAPIMSGLTTGGTETIYEYLTEALSRRAATINQPISLLCCDNIRGNGRVLQNALLAYLEAKGEPILAEWVRQNVTFPCSMVDRITPRSTDELQHEVHNHFPEHAVSPVHAESFLQWVIEDNFAAPVPDLAKVGVQIVKDVEPYEEAKIRILNGGHTGLAYLGALAGHQTFDQAMHDAELRAHFDRWESQEVLVGLGDKVPFDTSSYLAEIASRFENKGIADHLSRICMDGYSKMGIYVRPTLRACLEQGIVPEAGFDCVASWVIYVRRWQSGDCNVQYHEPLMDRLAPLIEPGQETKLASDPQLWGDLPERYEAFVPGLVAAIKRMDQKWQA